MLGDVYSNGDVVEKCDEFAFLLYKRTYEKAKDSFAPETSYRLGLSFLGVGKAEEYCYELDN
jgi:hypothetical protein